MKAKVSAMLTFDALVGPPDQMNNTGFYVNEQLAWPAGEWGEDDYTPALKAGDMVALSIPSGGLIGEVTFVNEYEGQVYVGVEGTWEGRANGLACGLSGCCDFKVHNATVVTSSTLPEGATIPYGLYEDIRMAAGVARKDKAKVMREIFDILLPYVAK